MVFPKYPGLLRWGRLALLGLGPLSDLGCLSLVAEQIEQLQRQVAQVTAPHQSTLRVTVDGQTRVFALNEQVIGFDGKSTAGTAVSRRVCAAVLDATSRVLAQASQAHGQALGTLTVSIATPPDSPPCTVTQAAEEGWQR
ncbi:MAG: hypothetical protein AB7N91_10765 [Candidatus Tectimicrobiota bacterium]